MKEIGIRAVAACNETDGAGWGSDEISEDSAKLGSGVGVLRSGNARLGVECETSTGGELLVGDQNVIMCDIQSIDGLCWSSHEYPSMATAEQSSGVKRNQTECRVPQGNSTSSVVYW